MSMRFTASPVNRRLAATVGLLSMIALAGALGTLAIIAWVDPLSALSHLEYGTLAYGWTLAVLTMLRLYHQYNGCRAALRRFPKDFTMALLGYTLVVLGNAADPDALGGGLRLLLPWAGALLLVLSVLAALYSRCAVPPRVRRASHGIGV